MSERHLLALGRLVVGFGRLEELARIAATSLITDDIGASLILTAELSFDATLNLLMSMVRFRFLEEDQIFRRVHVFVGAARKAEQDRNRLFHSNWSVYDDGRVRRAKRTAKNRGLRIQSDIVPPEEIEAVVDGVVELYVEAFHLSAARIVATPTRHDPYG